MLGTGYIIAMLVKVIIMFTLFYYLIPSRFIKFKEEDRFLDKVFISLVHSNFITIVIVHFLAFFKIYETLSLLICYVGVYFIINKIRGKTISSIIEAFGLRIIIDIFDLSEGNTGFIDGFAIRFKSWFYNLKLKLKKGFKSFFTNPFQGLLLFAVLGIAAYIRFKHSITHHYLGASDSYVHLAWAKYLGSNQIYRDGIYPYGYEAVISGLNKLSFVDPYMIVRFLGPFEGFLIVLSLYYILSRNFKKEKMLVWLAVFVYTVGFSGLPSYIWRQISALPQEYAIIFFFPGLHFYNKLFETKENQYLLLSAECLCLTLIIHPYVTVFLVIGYLVISFIHIKGALKLIVKLFIYMSGAGVVGILPLITGFLLGMPFHSSLGYIQSSAKLSDTHFKISALFNYKEEGAFLIFIICIIVFAALLILAILLRGKKVWDDVRVDIIFVLISIVLYMLYRAPEFGLPVLMDINRIGIFLSLVCVITYAMTFRLLGFLFKNVKIMAVAKAAICSITLLLVFNYTKLSVPEGAQLEYDGAAYSYINIKQDYPLFNWTIISPVEQYQQSFNYGWHVNLWEFVQTLSDPDIETYSVLTDYIFIFVEKYPLGSTEMINIDDANKDFPEVTGESVRYYTVPENRRIIEAKAFYWAESFMKEYSDMSIYYEDEHMRVYLIKQDSKNQINLKL